jgi:DNA replication protein DnaC
MKIYTTRSLLLEGDLPKPQPSEEVDTLRRRLGALRINFSAEALPDLLSQAVKEELGPPAFLDLILRHELECQEERRIKQALRISHLPEGRTLASFDFAYQRSVQRSQIETLSTCHWIARHQCLLLLGPPGVGKTHLCAALGVKAIESGFSVAFYRVDELLHQLKRDAELSPTQLKHRKYMASSLLLVDEMGYQAFSREEANLFFRVVNYRYDRGSIGLTSNKPIMKWAEMLGGDEVLATAILDRLLHAGHVVNIRGQSYRLKDLDESLQQQQESQKETT